MLDPGVARADARGAQPGGAVGAVDVQPDLVLPAGLGRAGEVVEQPRVGGPGGGHGGEHAVGAGQRRAQRVPPHPAVLVGRHGQHPDVHEPRRRAHGRVHLLAAGDLPAPGRGARATMAGVLARRVQGGEVAVGAALHEAPAGAGRQAGEVREPAQRLVLGVHGARALQPAAAVHRARAQQQLDERGGRGRRRRDEREVARVVDRDRQRQQHVAEAPQRLLRPEALRGDRRPCQRRDLGGSHRAPERGRVRGEALERGGEDPLTECAQLGRELVHQPAIRRALAAWIARCAPLRRASGSFASAPWSRSACT